MADRAGDSGPRTLAPADRPRAAVATRHVSATDWTTSEHLRSLVDNSTTGIYAEDAAGRGTRVTFTSPIARGDQETP